MRNKARTANAMAAAQSYAPRPSGSAVTYGLIAASLVLVAAFIAGAFFGVDILRNWSMLATMAAGAFAAGVVLRLWRQREHVDAVDSEYVKRTPASPIQALAPDTAMTTSTIATKDRSEVQETVTFRWPFTLPGLDPPHPPGTFQVSSRSEPLDVSWDASVITKMIMLTGNGSVEALDVKSEDLAEALRLDQAKN